MRNSVARLAFVGAGQVLPGVGREFSGRTSWAMALSVGSASRTRLAPLRKAQTLRERTLSWPNTRVRSTGAGSALGRNGRSRGLRGERTRRDALRSLASGLWTYSQPPASICRFPEDRGDG